MKDVTQALDVAIFIRNYLKKNQLVDSSEQRKIQENHERITNQVKGIGKL